MPYLTHISLQYAEFCFQQEQDVYLFLYSFQTSSGALSIVYGQGTEAFSSGLGGRNLKLTTELHLVFRLMLLPHGVVFNP